VYNKADKFEILRIGFSYTKNEKNIKNEKLYKNEKTHQDQKVISFSLYYFSYESSIAKFNIAKLNCF